MKKEEEKEREDERVNDSLNVLHFVLVGHLDLLAVRNQLPLRHLHVMWWRWW